jgi:hypothetical protein
MFKAIKNITSAVTDLTAIVTKETVHQINSANDCCTDATRRVAWKAGLFRRNYEQRLAIRKRKPLVIECIYEDK